MTARTPTLPFLLAASLLVPSATHAAWPPGGHINVPVAVAPGSQVYPAIAGDGSGGAFIAWHDNRSGGYDLYVQHVDAQGRQAWTPNGLAVGSAPNDQANAQLVADGAGGVIVVWHDLRTGQWDIYGQRLDAAGVPQWAPNGVPLCTASGHQQNPMIAADGAGGAFVVWSDTRAGNFDLYAQRVNAAGAAQWTANGVAVCNAVGTQSAPQLVADGVGGVTIVWQDQRTGEWDIVMQRLDAAGNASWTPNGFNTTSSWSTNIESPVITSDGAQGTYIAYVVDPAGSGDIDVHHVTASGGHLWSIQRRAGGAAGVAHSPRIVPDGAGGVIVGWIDGRAGTPALYAQRMTNSSVAWTTNGVLVATSPNGLAEPNLVSDGAGGAVVTWRDNYGLYAQRLSPAGTLLWPSAVNLASAGAYATKDWSRTASDGSGGVIMSWHDTRNGPAHDVYAQRVDRHGNIGSPEPEITGVHDVPNDQGGRVRVAWAASQLDAELTYGIAEYRVWRSAPTAPSPGSVTLHADRHATTDADEAAATGAWWTPDGTAAESAWEYVGTLPATAVPFYSLVTATTSDSLPDSNPLTAFMVEARAGTAPGSPRWLSQPDSGYSVDNLPPAAPAALTGSYASGTTVLHWLRNTESDFAHYRVYRGSSASFTPDPSNRIAAPPDTGWADPNGTPAYYKVSAVDSHGNESAFALLTPGIVDAPGEGPIALVLAPPSPSPTRGTAQLSFELPRAATMALTVHDPAGRTVRTLVRGAHEAGRFRLAWDLRDDAGRDVAPGIYFVRLTAEGRSRTQRMITLR